MKSVKDIYIFIGPPGSGKGSLAHLCKKHFGWAHLSTGNVCRQHIANKTPLGKQIEKAIQAGHLIQDDIIISLVDEWMDEMGQKASAVIVDGFPRTVHQAEALDSFFSHKGIGPSSVTIVALHISDQEVVKRLKNRFVCSSEECQAVFSFDGARQNGTITCPECGHVVVQRPDDRGDVVQERLKVYHSSADNLLNYYRKSPYTVVDLNVESPLSVVFDTFLKAGERRG